MRTIILACAIAALAFPAASLAETKSVDATTKTATFSGTITSDPLGAYDVLGFVNDGTDVQGQSVCVQPLCDEHTLKVGEGGAELRLAATSDAYNISLQVIDPDGTSTSMNDANTSSERDGTFDPIPGDWTIRVYGSPDTTSFDYDLKATFRTPEDVAQDPPADE